jgi:hypothetical protein
MSTLITADLRFTLERDGQAPLSGRLAGRANRLVLEVDDPGAFAGSADAPVVRALAEGLARRGMQVRVTQGERHLITLGSTRAPWWQRLVTRSRHIRLGSLRGALVSARSRATDTAAALPDAGLLPPPTLWPLVPTMHRRVRRAATTHDPAQGGAARLVLVKDSYLPGERQLVVWLHDGLTIGSGPSCDVRLPGLADVHARLRHDADDEWVIEALAAPSRVHGAPVESAILRTGARITLGTHQLAYFREEYADHGRPFGGRIGGELGHQRPQPPRPGHVGPDF